MNEETPDLLAAVNDHIHSKYPDLPASGRLMWVDEATHYERTGQLMGPKQLIKCYKDREGWYGFQDGLRTGRGREFGPEEFDRNEFTPRQRRRIRKKENQLKAIGLRWQQRKAGEQ